MNIESEDRACTRVYRERTHALTCRIPLAVPAIRPSTTGLPAVPASSLGRAGAEYPVLGDDRRDEPGRGHVKGRVVRGGIRGCDREWGKGGDFTRAALLVVASGGGRRWVWLI